jgi:hypothetical protein
MPQKAETVQLRKTSGRRSPYFPTFVSIHIDKFTKTRKTSLENNLVAKKMASTFDFGAIFKITGGFSGKE